MDSPQSDDERLQQADAGKDLLSKKMKLLIIMLSLVIIILLLPLASDHGLPLLKPMGISMLQRLWDAMRFIAMTAAISVGIISTSSQRNEGGSNRSALLRSHRSSTPIASSSREPTNPNMVNNFDRGRSGFPNLAVDRGVNDSLHQTSGGTELGSLRKSKGKDLMDDFSTAPSSSDDFSTVPSSSDAFPYAIKEEESYGLQRTSADHVHSQRAPSQEENYGNLKPRPTNSRRRLSASDAWFLSLRIDEEMAEEGKSARAMPVQSLEGSPTKKFTSRVDDKGHRTIKSADRGSTNAFASMTDDNYAELRMRKATLSRFVNETQDAIGKGHHRRSSSVDRRRPIHYDDQGPDRPGLKQILMDVSKERASKGKLPNSSLIVKEQLDRPHSAHASVSSNPNAVSTPSSRQPSTGTWQTDSGRSNMGANQILQKQSDSEQPRVIKMDDYQTANQVRQTRDHAIKDHNQKMQENTHPHQVAQRRDDSYQAMVDFAQIKQKQVDDLQARAGFNQNLHKQADTKMAIPQTLKKADARMGPHLDSFQSTLQKPNMSSRSKLLLQSSKHSRSELNLEQLGQKVDTVRVTQPGAKSYERRKSFSYDFGDGFNPDLLWELEPPPPPGFMDEQMVRTCRNREADRSSFLSATPKPNEASSTLVQELVPWRTSAPIDISAYPPRTPSPLDPLSQGTGPSSSEVNRRAEEFISKFTTKLLRQRQESMERRRRYG